MQAVDTQVTGGALTGFFHLIFNLSLNLGNNLLTACGVYAAVGYKLVQSQTGNLTTDRIKCRNYDSLGGVIYYNFYTACGLYGADITSFTANDASLHLVILNVEYGNGVLNGGLGTYALYGLDDNLFGLLAGGHLGIVHDFVDV